MREIHQPPKTCSSQIFNSVYGPAPAKGKSAEDGVV